MKIVLIGYGKMGKTIEEKALKKGHNICGIVSADNHSELSVLAHEADVAIEFTNPEAAYDNITKCLELKLPVVSGTTGWLDKYDEVARMSQTQKTGLFYASNYSIGVNIFFAINKKLAALMHPYSDYNVQIDETHHIHKLDEPSGTAITTAEGILSHLDQKKDWLLNAKDQDKITIVSHREGEVYGKHTVHYNSPIDEIILTHNAHNRDGFALGAITAAEWIIDKQGPYGMADMLGL